MGEIIARRRVQQKVFLFQRLPDRKREKKSYKYSSSFSIDVEMLIIGPRSSEKGSVDNFFEFVQKGRLSTNGRRRDQPLTGF
jgi:hypothetical protein